MERLEDANILTSAVPLASDLSAGLTQIARKQRVFAPGGGDDPTASGMQLVIMAKRILNAYSASWRSDYPNY